MADHLDLEEQEQLDKLKQFWKQYGNSLSTVVLLVCLAVAGWNGYGYWQKRQAAQAALMFDNAQSIFQSGDVKAAERVYSDMSDSFKSSFYTLQAGLQLAKMAYENGQTDVAKTALEKVAQSGGDEILVATAKLRLSQVLVEQKTFDQALAALDGKFPEGFAALVADARGDVQTAQDQKDAAIASYTQAIKAMDEKNPYRNIVDAKLAALGGAAVHK